MISPRQVSSSWFSDGDGRDGDARGSCGRVFEGVSALCILTLNLGTKRVNSWCQLLSVDAGEMIRNGPQMLSLCAGTKRRIHRQPPQQVLAHVCVCVCACASAQITGCNGETRRASSCQWKHVFPLNSTFSPFGVMRLFDLRIGDSQQWISHVSHSVGLFKRMQVHKDVGCLWSSTGGGEQLNIPQSLLKSLTSAKCASRAILWTVFPSPISSARIPLIPCREGRK